MFDATTPLLLKYLIEFVGIQFVKHVFITSFCHDLYLWCVAPQIISFKDSNLLHKFAICCILINGQNLVNINIRHFSYTRTIKKTE